MLINTVLHNEADRNAHMLNEYRNLLAQLPKGSLICRKDYYYLKYRENGKICDKYIGKAGSTVDQLREQLELRKHYSDMLNALEQYINCWRKSHDRFSRKYRFG